MGNKFLIYRSFSPPEKGKTHKRPAPQNDTKVIITYTEPLRRPLFRGLEQRHRKSKFHPFSCDISVSQGQLQTQVFVIASYNLWLSRAQDGLSVFMSDIRRTAYRISEILRRLADSAVRIRHFGCFYEVVFARNQCWVLRQYVIFCTRS